jgi:hypothetical protein
METKQDSGTTSYESVDQVNRILETMARLQTHSLHRLQSHRMPSNRERIVPGERLTPRYHHLNVSRARDYDIAFTRQTGWTGADGAYSVALRDGRTLWLFSDTLIGEVDARGQRTLDQRVPRNPVGEFVINNSIAIQSSRDPAGVRFFTGDNDGVPANVFTPENKDHWFWVNAGVLNTDDTVTVLLNSFQLTPDPNFKFGRQIALWAVDLKLQDNTLNVGDYRRIQSVEAADAAGNETVWGAAILEDGFWTYIYGSQFTAGSPSWQRGLVVARTPTGRLGDSRAWRFFDGRSYVKDSRRTLRIPLAVPNEFTVQQLSSGRYLLTLADNHGPVSLSFSEAPTGPWSEPQPIWITPETTDTVCTYHPKAHPGLSDLRGLLISYNVNSFDMHESLVEANIYRPRFIRVPWESIDRLAENAAATVQRPYCIAVAA